MGRWKAFACVYGGDSLLSKTLKKKEKKKKVIYLFVVYNKGVQIMKKRWVLEGFCMCVWGGSLLSKTLNFLPFFRG